MMKNSFFSALNASDAEQDPQAFVCAAIIPVSLKLTQGCSSLDEKALQFISIEFPLCNSAFTKAQGFKNQKEEISCKKKCNFRGCPFDEVIKTAL